VCGVPSLILSGDKRGRVLEEIFGRCLKDPSMRLKKGIISKEKEKKEGEIPGRRVSKSRVPHPGVLPGRSMQGDASEKKRKRGLPKRTKSCKGNLPSERARLGSFGGVSFRGDLPVKENGNPTGKRGGMGENLWGKDRRCSSDRETSISLTERKFRRKIT